MMCTYIQTCINDVHLYNTHTCFSDEHINNAHFYADLHWWSALMEVQDDLRGGLHVVEEERAQDLHEAVDRVHRGLDVLELARLQPAPAAMQSVSRSIIGLKTFA